MPYTEWSFRVTAKITVNGEHLIRSTWISNLNYDDCHRQIENFIKKTTKSDDAVIKEIITADSQQFIVKEPIPF